MISYFNNEHKSGRVAGKTLLLFEESYRQEKLKLFTNKANVRHHCRVEIVLLGFAIWCFSYVLAYP